MRLSSRQRFVVTSLLAVAMLPVAARSQAFVSAATPIILLGLLLRD
jgi:hypothetical protein